jgi:GH24 family phage-related lysozyme (muramidase)
MSALSEQLLDEEEGRSSTVYTDTRGFLTISRGCLVDPKVSGAGLCGAAMAAQDAHDSAAARAIAEHFPHFTELNEVRQAVLISMAFQLGSKPLHWPDFMAALEKRDYVVAAAAGLDSDWARDQTPRRAKRQMTMLSSASWVER